MSQHMLLDFVWRFELPVLSAVGRAAIVKAAEKRWAKVRKQAKKVAA